MGHPGGTERSGGGRDQDALYACVTFSKNK